MVIYIFKIAQKERINDSNVYFVQTKFNENYSYKFKISNTDGAASFDNSYISFFLKIIS